MDELERRQLATKLKELKESLDRESFNAESGMSEYHFNTTNEGAILNAIGFLRSYQKELCEIAEALLKDIAK